MRPAVVLTPGLEDQLVHAQGQVILLSAERIPVVVGVPPGREEDGSGLAGHAGDAQDHGGDQAHPGRREHDPEHGAPLGRPERQRRLLEGPRDDGDHLLGGTGDDRQHHDGEGQCGGESRLAGLLLRHHPQEIDEEAGDDGR